ncbi:glycosyltransferase family 2 protein [Pantoea allii]|uniref:glycosyltransferase family 2 protein n=1 Tax=Pantoea allii TaxID=574096 RepID=UPI001F4D5AD3|nr:glycosyltransferase family 2 protein [Pantoea allii]
MITFASLVLYKHKYDDVKLTIECLLNESSVSKVVIVDNGSHCKWLLEIVHPKLEVILNPDNNGFGAGHNEMIKKFKDRADFILICNPDISFEKGEVDKFIQFSAISDTGLSIPKIIYPDGSLQRSCKLLPSPLQLFLRRFLSRTSTSTNNVYELTDADYSRPFFAPSISGCFMLVSREAFSTAGFFDTRYFMYLEDVDLSRRISSAGLNVRYCPYACIVHESQRRSYQSRKFLIYHIKSAISYFNKWGWFLDKERKRLNKKCLSELPRYKVD